MANIEQTLPIELEPGELYRRGDLHASFNGQRQGGISTPAQYKIILLFTGDNGSQHGYKDGWIDDRVFFYTGEGQIGDMEFTRGNAAIRDHESRGKTLHLFSQVSHNKGFVRYMGQMRCTGYHFEDGIDTEGNNRRIIIFELTLA